MKTKRRAVFLDRDGVINIDYGYVHRCEDIKFISETFEFCKEKTKDGFLLFIVTNQSGIERGLFTVDEYKNVEKFVEAEFEHQGMHICETMYCPYLVSNMRKPNPGMILELAAKYNIDLTASIGIGNSSTDIEAYIRSGITEIYEITNNQLNIV